MKNIKKIKWTLLLLQTLIIISCSKKSAIQGDENINVQSKSGARTSAIKYYGKDTTTTVTTIDVTPGPGYQIVYSLGPYTLSAGDVISVHFQQQVSYPDLSNNVMIGSGVLIGTSAAVSSNGSSGFVNWVANKTGTNATIDEAGTEVVSRTGSYTVTAENANVPLYINAILYGADLTGGLSSANVNIPAGYYGELVAVVESGVTRYATFNQNFVSMKVSGASVVNKSLGPYTIPANTMVDTRYDFSPTSDSHMPDPNTQRIGRWVSQETGPSTTTGTTRLLRPIQRGITHAEHHASSSSAGGLFYGSQVNNAYFNAVVYANGWTDGHGLTIDQSSQHLYGNFVIEMRSSAPGNFLEDTSNNITSVDATPRVLYSVGPMSINPGQVVEVRYHAAFEPDAGTTVVAKIVRARSALATTGANVQQRLVRRFHSNYLYNSMHQSTADRNNTDSILTGQYYNVVMYRTNGASTLPVMSWGELEAVKR